MRKGIVIEQIALMALALVIVVIGISLVMNFMGVKTDIPAMFIDSVNTILRGSYIDPERKPPVVDGTYTSERVAKHVKTCWDDTRSSKQDVPCIILRGDFSTVTDAGINASLSDLDPVAKEHTTITTTTAPFATADLVVVYYDYSEDIIEVKS